MNIEKTSQLFRNYINYTWSIGGSGQILYETLLISPLSVLTNIFLIFLTFQSSELKEHSRYFIANTAFLDLCLSGIQIYLGLFYSICFHFDIEISVLHCTVTYCLLYGFSSAALLSGTSTIICRFNEVIFENKCKSKLIFCLLLYPYSMFIFMLTYAFLLADSVRDLYFCRVFYTSRYHLVIVAGAFLLISISFVAQMTLSVALFSHLKWHFQHISVNLHTNANDLEKLNQERSILKAVFIQGAAPVILATPVCIRLVLDEYFDVLNPDTPLFTLGYLKVTLRNITVFVYSFNPLVDSLSVLFIMLAYVKARRKFTTTFLSKLSELLRA